MGERGVFLFLAFFVSLLIFSPLISGFGFNLDLEKTEIGRTDSLNINGEIFLDFRDQYLPVNKTLVFIIKNESIGANGTLSSGSYYTCIFDIFGNFLEGCDKNNLELGDVQLEFGEGFGKYNGLLYEFGNVSGLNSNYTYNLTLDTTEFETDEYIIATVSYVGKNSFIAPYVFFTIHPIIEVYINSTHPANASRVNSGNLSFNFDMDYDFKAVNNEPNFKIQYCYLNLTEIKSGNASIISKTYDALISNGTIVAELIPNNYRYRVECVDTNNRKWEGDEITFEAVLEETGVLVQEIIESEENGCTTEWVCSDWSICDANGQQNRVCEKERFNCFASLSSKPAEIQSCNSFENLSGETDEQGLFSRITGAVTGILGNFGVIGVVLFVLAISGATYFVYNRRVKNKAK